MHATLHGQGGPMSFWIRTKDEGGKERTLLVDFPVLLLVAVTVATASRAVLFYLSRPNRLVWHGIGLMVAGLVALAVAKASRFRHGEWWSWGPGRMSKAFRRVYFVAYCLMAVGLVMAAVYLTGNV